ncbi:HAD family hydrolase [mine drainage metagenome]|uniref:HAD family hydrolase n=1 Tax=mine drainage metagenome TaxID=410659 RepID=T1ATX6_9ZZZZ
MGLAVFDLDGTLTRHNTFGPYLLGMLVRRPWRLLRLPAALPAAVGFGLGLCGRGALKGALMRATLGGIARADLARWSERFATHWAAHETFASARAALQAHARAGDHLVLMSASPDLYVPAIGRALGFQEIICTEVRWDGDRLDGRLSTANCRGDEKVRRLRQLRERVAGAASAYGNSITDIAHLALVEHGVLVNGTARARRTARRTGLTCERWR